MAKEIPIFKPGAFANFRYYFVEILNTLFLMVFTMALSILAVLYFLTMFDVDAAPAEISSQYGGPWTFWYQFQNIATLLFLILFVFMLKQNLVDLFSKTLTTEMKIDKKGISRTGNKVGSRTCYIAGGSESFSVTQKVFDALQEGDVIKVRYTKAQHNVRTITLLRRKV
jgi:hypothetical protein